MGKESYIHPLFAYNMCIKNMQDINNIAKITNNYILSKNIALDTNNLDFLIGDADFKKHLHINIDHHISNTFYASELNYVRICPSNTMLVFDLFKNYIYGDTATYIISGILGDTGFLKKCISNEAFKKVFATINCCIKNGGDYKQAVENVEKAKELDSLLIYRRIISRLKIKDNIAYTYLKKNENIFSYEVYELIGKIKGITEYIIIKEISNKKVKVYWHSTVKKDIYKVANQFGGGGHFYSAVFILDTSLRESFNKVLDIVTSSF